MPSRESDRGESALQIRHGLKGAILLHEQIAEILVGLGERRCQRNRLTEPLLGFGGPVHLD